MPAGSTTADPELRLYQYTAIDEHSRYRILGAFTEQSTYSSADFLRRVVEDFRRKGVKIECVQTDNGFEFINRFSPTPDPCAPLVGSLSYGKARIF